MPIFPVNARQAIFAYSMYEYRAPKYGDYVYPEWAVYVGWGLAGVSLVQIPLWALLTMLYYLCKWVRTRPSEEMNNIGET